MLPVTLDRTRSEPLGVQLSGRIRDLLATGTLSRGDRLPSSRALAGDLAVSRSITEQAYEQLIAEGWLETRHGAGTFVASDGGSRLAVRPRPTRPAVSALIKLDTGTPWIDPRHAAGWRRAWREVSAASPPRGYDDPRGLPDLRVALADQLARTRGLSLDPDELVVTGGTTDGLRHLLAALPAGPVAIEDPGYRAAAETVLAAGRRVIDLPVAEPITAETDLAGVAAAYVTPAHQHPLGRVLPAAERLALLGAARRADAVVIEDDYDSEFRYDVAPVPALASLDRTRVAYLGTASKSVAPSLRLGWLVPPPNLLDTVNHQRALTHDAVPWPTQRAMIALLRDGYVGKVVRSARRVYAERAAGRGGPDALRRAGRPAGRDVLDLAAAPARCPARAVRGTERRVRGQPALGLLPQRDLTGLVVGFGGVTDAELDRALAALTSAL